MTKTRAFFPVLLLAFAGFCGWRSARADSFVPLPQVGGENAALKIRVIKYEGSVNGGMLVEINNPTNSPQEFVADGLFFVPAGDPEKAPQRLGAAGPFQEIQGNKSSPHVQKVALVPGETKRLAIEVFCIDSHRGGPNSSTQFSVAKERLPPKLRQSIRTGNDKILEGSKGDVQAAKSAIQSNMWSERDK